MEKMDMKDFMVKVHQVKIEAEIKNMKVAAAFVGWTFNQLINEVENIIDSEKMVKHSAIQKKIENYLEKDDKMKDFLKKNPGVEPTFLEYSLPILIQSGDNFSLNKFSVQSDNNQLTSETVYINVCGKYKEMSTMASRTFLVNPIEQQKSAYMIANEALDVCIKNLKVGEPISNAFKAAKRFIEGKNSDLANKIHNNFGFGIGAAFKEESLLINETNEMLVKPRMVFHVRITFNEVVNKPSKAPIAIGETVLVDKEGK